MKNDEAPVRNEAALACAARQGDQDAMLRLLRANWTWLKGIAYNILGNSDDVDDVLQEICVLLINNIATLKQPERFKPWLAVVARNAALAFRQRRSRLPSQLDDLLVAGQQDDRQDDIVETLSQQEQHRRILDSLRHIPEKYREAFILKHIEDYSYAEIADMLDVAVTTVQIRLVRARRMIQNHLTGKPNHKIPRT